MNIMCEECEQDDPHCLAACTYCGATVCYDCLDEHEEMCQDLGE